MKTGFKAFDKDMICQDFKYEENSEYKIKGKPVLCEKGFHYCENPFNVLNYYDLCDSEFAEIEDHGDSQSDDSKTVTNHIKIKGKLSLAEFIKASFDFLWEKCYSSKLAASGDSSQLAASGYFSKLAASGYSSQLAASGNSSQLAASGDSSKLATSGYSSQLAASGDYSQLAASGDYSQLAASGENSICAGIGTGNIAKGILGTWIVLAEFDDKGKVICVKSAEIDGKKLMPDTWYKVKNRKFIKVQ